jgi:hypothetical protein
MTRKPVLVLAATVLVLIAPAPHAFSDDQLGLSHDGQTWSTDLRGGLFDPGLRWVPGDRRTAAFYVRNQAREPARLIISIDSTRHDQLMESGDLSVTARSADGDWTLVNTPGSHELLRVPTLPSGARERVDVTVALAADASNLSQGKTLDLAFDIRLEQRTDNPGQRGSFMPGTGGVFWWLVLVAAVLVTMGWVVLAVRRRSNEHDD